MNERNRRVTDKLNATPLHDVHLGAGARMVPFAGYSMPIQYPTGIRAEHAAVREGAGLFDVSHMGVFEFAGAGAGDLLQRVTVNDVTRLAVGQAQYSALCNEDGFVLDDVLVYRRSTGYAMVVNASNRKGNWDWIARHATGFDAQLADASPRTALIALQGPAAQAILAPLAPDADLDALGYYRFQDGGVAEFECMISRTGYTGEDGFELYVAAADAPNLWHAVMDAGAPHGLIPCGLGARDSLRLEVGYALYGNDLDREHTALESGLGWIVKLGKGDFVGREALAAQKERGVERRLTGMRLTERGFPRPGYPIVHDGAEVGTVTSGVLSPTLGDGVALGYVPAELARPGAELGILIRGRTIPALTQRPPFYKDGSIKR